MHRYKIRILREAFIPFHSRVRLLCETPLRTQYGAKSPPPLPRCFSCASSPLIPPKSNVKGAMLLPMNKMDEFGAAERSLSLQQQDSEDAPAAAEGI